MRSDDHQGRFLGLINFGSGSIPDPGSFTGRLTPLVSAIKKDSDTDPVLNFVLKPLYQNLYTIFLLGILGATE